MFHAYILKSGKNNSFYIGSCKDISIRLNLHNNGLVKSTKRYIPWTLVYYEEFDRLGDSRRGESQIKKWKSRRAIERLVEHFKI